MQAILFIEQLHANVVLFIDWIHVQIIHNYNVSFDLTIFGSLPIIITGSAPDCTVLQGGHSPPRKSFLPRILLDFTT